MSANLTTHRIFSLFIIAASFSTLASAADPTTTASGTTNGEPYSFGTWTGHPVIMALNCSPGTSDCNSTRYCIDTSDSCDPVGPSGADYSGEVNVSSQGTLYMRYASNSSSGAWGDVGSRKMMIDITPPAISIQDNAAGGWAVSDTISVLAGDIGSGIYSVRWIARDSQECNASQDAELDSGYEGVSLVASDSSIYFNKYICFRAIDNAGGKNYTVSDRLSGLDTIAPNVSAGEDVTTNSPFSRQGLANDPISGIANVLWAKESGPGLLNFSDSHSLNTTISADTDGIYAVRLTVTDGAGNIGYSSFTLKWSTAPPEISINEPDTLPARNKTISASSQGATLVLSVTNGTVCNGTLPFTAYSNLTFKDDSDNGKRVCYRAIDSLGNYAFRLSAPIGGIRTKKPVIAISGSAALELEVGRNYTDAGATAKDGYGNDLTGMVLARGEVDIWKLGEYAITYTVTDAAGNSAEPAVRKVKVVDRIAPVISISGNTSVKVQKGGNYTDEGASAKDNYDGDLTGKIAVQNFVDTGKAGPYFVTYSVSDSSGNSAQAQRSVEVYESPLMFAVMVIAGLAGISIFAAAGVAAYMIFLRKKRGL